MNVDVFLVSFKLIAVGGSPTMFSAYLVAFLWLKPLGLAF
jgi:hypothetical protein